MVAPAHVSQYLRHEKRKSLINKGKINGLFLEDVFEVVLEVVHRLVVAHEEVLEVLHLLHIAHEEVQQVEGRVAEDVAVAMKKGPEGPCCAPGEWG